MAVSFFGAVAVIYALGSWYLTGQVEWTGTVTLAIAIGFGWMVGFWLLMAARRSEHYHGLPPEERLDAEIEEGAGEYGFFSPHSWWPLYCGLSLALAVLGVVFGWWLFLIAVGVGTVSVLGLVFEYYRGVHAH